MSDHPVTDPGIRDVILSDPAPILDDPDIMRALVTAEDLGRGDNVVDLRSAAMGRLEARLDRLEETHRTVIAAAYENQSGTNTIHRAILTLLEPADLETFLTTLAGPVADTMRAVRLHLVLETGGDAPAMQEGAGPLHRAAPGSCAAYAGADRAVTLRQVPGDPWMYGDVAPQVQSEACLMLDLGADYPPAMLVLGAASPTQFAPGQGTDLLAFFAGVLERTLRRFLA